MVKSLILETKELINSLFACGFGKQFRPELDRQNVRPDLDLNSLKL